MCPERLQREREDRVDLAACKGRRPPLLVTGFPITASWFGKKLLTVRQREASLCLIPLKSLAKKKAISVNSLCFTDLFFHWRSEGHPRGRFTFLGVSCCEGLSPKLPSLSFTILCSLLDALKFIRNSWRLVRNKRVVWFEAGTRNVKKEKKSQFAQC